MKKTLAETQFGPNAAKYRHSAVHAKGSSLKLLVELARPKPEDVVLDIATGAGHTAAAFAPHVAKVIASDITEEMLAEAQGLAADKGLSNVETRRADAEHLPFKDQIFDIVTCRIAPHHFRRPEKFVAEVHRVLKAGGTFGLVDNITPDEETAPGFDGDALRRAGVELNEIEKLRDPSHERALSRADWEDLVGRAGFGVEHVEELRKKMGFLAWCANMSVAPELEQKLRQRIDAASPALKAFLKPRGVGAALKVDFAEMVLVARRAA